jgi:hypothetical protein
VDADHTQWGQFPAATDDDRMYVFVAQRRPESYAWDVPPNDHDLLTGVGAWGDGRVKFDDTFESLLFLSLDNDDCS